MFKHCAIAAAAFVWSAASAAAQTVTWPTEIAAHFTASPHAVLGAPDGVSTALSDYHYIWVRNFSNDVSYGGGLETAMGLAPGELANWDVIAFEDNGGSAASGGGWESSIWFFTDQRNAAAGAFNEATGAANGSGGGVAFRTGSLSGAIYNSLFGSSSSSAVVSWILVNAPDEIDTHSPTFSVWVSGALLGEGSPDPDAIGLMR